MAAPRRIHRLWSLLLVAALFAAAAFNAKPDPVLSLTTTELRLGREHVWLVRDLLTDDYLNIPSLETALEQERSAGGSNPCGAVEIDGAVGFRVMRRVLFTCAVSGNDTSFVLPLGDAIEVSVPNHMVDGRLTRVFMSPTGFRASSDWGVELPSTDEAPSRAELTGWYDPHTTLLLLPDDDVTAANALHAYQALRRAGLRVRLD